MSPIRRTKPFFFLALIICLCKPHDSQAQEFDSDQRQDSIFNAITDILNVHNSINSTYREDNQYHELRYNHLQGFNRKVYYSDILKDTLTFDPDNFVLTYNDTAVVSPLFLPLVFDSKLVFDPSFRLEPIVKDQSLFPSLEEIRKQYLYNERRLRDSIQWAAYAYVRNHDPRVIKYTKNDFPAELEKTEEIKVNVFKDLFKVESSPDLTHKDTPSRYITKRKYWTITGSNAIQFSQSWLSDNWYKGGSENLNLLSIQKANIDYAKDKLTFKNSVEWRLSLNNFPVNDSTWVTRIGEDQFRTYSTFGIKAFDKWSYTTSLEIKTQLLNNYKDENSPIVSSLFSPVYINMGIFGMNYTLNKNYKNSKYKRYNLTADIMPLSVQYTYVANYDVNPSRYGIPEGDHHLSVFGSTVNARLTCNLSKTVSFTSRFKYFTNYEHTILESENELNLPINRFFSTRIYFYGRFDDSPGIKKDDKLGYFQINEMLTFGFNYKW